MTQEEFLLDTLEYYSLDTSRRCTNKDGRCYYSPKNAVTTGNGCAIGRHLPDALKEALDAASDGDGITVEALFTDGDYPHLHQGVPDLLKNLPVDFLYKVQRFHDGNQNWNSSGLTDDGKRWVKATILFLHMDENKFQKYLH